MPLSSSPTRTPPARSPWADAPALTVVLVVAAARLAMPGPAKVWLAASGVVALLLVGSAMGPLPGWFAAAAGGSLRQYLAFVLVVALGVAAVWLHRNPGRRERVFAWAAGGLLGGGLVVGLVGGDSPNGGP